MNYSNQERRYENEPSWRSDATSNRYGRGYGGTRNENRPLLVRAPEDESDGTVELRDARDRIEIAVDLPEDLGDGDGVSDGDGDGDGVGDGNGDGVSLEDVDVSLTGADLHIRADPQTEGESDRDGFERQISLTRSVRPESAVVFCADSTLTVALPKVDSA
jgi:hypothetical protein